MISGENCRLITKKSIAKSAPILGVDAAIGFAVMNNGESIELAPNGSPSSIYEYLQPIYGGDEVATVKARAQIAEAILAADTDLWWTHFSQAMRIDPEDKQSKYAVLKARPYVDANGHLHLYKTVKLYNSAREALENNTLTPTSHLIQVKEGFDDGNSFIYSDSDFKYSLATDYIELSQRGSIENADRATALSRLLIHKLRKIKGINVYPLIPTSQSTNPVYNEFFDEVSLEAYNEYAVTGDDSKLKALKGALNIQEKVFGITKGNNIFINDLAIFNPETFLHEYTHVWAVAMLFNNPLAWMDIKNLLRDTDVWLEVLGDILNVNEYRKLDGDEDAITREVLARISGRYNSQKIANSTFSERLLSALEKFWNWVGKNIFNIRFNDPSKTQQELIDSITDRVLFDFLNETDLNLPTAALTVIDPKTLPITVEELPGNNIRGALGWCSRNISFTEEEKEILATAPKNELGQLLAPNGEVSHLTQKLYAIVRTKAFKEWFGDWENDPQNASKVVDENGEPLVVYHGSSELFELFDLHKGGATTGIALYIDPVTGEVLESDSKGTIFFSDLEDQAISYAFLSYYLKVTAASNALNHILSSLGHLTKLDVSDIVAALRVPNIEELNKLALNIEAVDLAQMSREDLKQFFAYHNILELNEKFWNITDLYRGLSNSVHNTRRILKEIETLRDNIDRLKKNDRSIQLEFGDFTESTFSMSAVSESKSYVGVFLEDNSRIKFVATDKFGNRQILYFDQASDEEISRLFDILEYMLLDWKINVQLDLNKYGYGEHKHLYPVFLKMTDPYAFDYEGSAFPDRFKKTKYSTAMAAARLVTHARQRRQDGVIYLNIVDPFNSNSFGVFSEDLIYYLPTKESYTVRIARDYTPEQFWDYILGNSQSKYSDLKKLVFKRLAELGYTEEYLRTLLTSKEDYDNFIKYHEYAHVKLEHHDRFLRLYGDPIYGKESIQIEVEATLLAIKQIQFEKLQKLDGEYQVTKTAVTANQQLLIIRDFINFVQQFEKVNPMAISEGTDLILEKLILKDAHVIKMLQEKLEKAIQFKNSLKELGFMIIGSPKFKDGHFDYDSYYGGGDSGYKPLNISKDISNQIKVELMSELVDNDEALKQVVIPSLLFNVNVPKYSKKARNIYKLCYKINGEWDLNRLKLLIKSNPEYMFDFLCIDKDQAISARLEAHGFKRITKEVHKDAEVIMPKVFRGLMRLGDFDLCDIDPEFYKKVPTHYLLLNSLIIEAGDAKVVDLDFVIRGINKSYNLVIKPNLDSEALARYGTLVKDSDIIIDEEGYRLNKRTKERMYKLPPQKQFAIYRNKVTGVETIVIKSSAEAWKYEMDLMKSDLNIISVQPFMISILKEANVNDLKLIVRDLKDLNLALPVFDEQLAKVGHYIGNFAYHNPDSQKIDLDTYITMCREMFTEYNKILKTHTYDDLFRELLYNSFLLSLEVIATRIPTQNMSSIMTMKMGAFTNTNVNNVFVTKWQLWLLGSDYDIKLN